MKLMIDIPYGLKDVYEHGNVTALDVEEMKRAIANGTPIPDNATNGDVVKATTNFIGVQDEEDTIKISTNWWNAPYQKGGNLLLPYMNP